MKVLFPLAFLLMALPVSAQEVSQPRQPNAEQVAFSNLPEEQRKQFLENLQEANRLFQQKRIFEAIAALDKADAIFPNSSEALNFRGSCFVEMRAFDKALENYEKARKISPGNLVIQFNIAEVYFVTKRWKEAHDLFKDVLAALPMESVGLNRLVEFKILLCQKKLGMTAEATALAEKYDYMDDSPFYYFAQAAKAYDEKDEVKAEGYLASAARVFRNSEVLSPWQDTMIEYGYVKSFYGGDVSSSQ
ncbi:MAG: tetratricopeptide repeat protein [Luteolibacter sp.]